MANGDMARLFHRLTSYEPGREWTDTVPDPWIVTSFEPNDLELLPPPVKEFPAGLPVVPLPRELPTTEHGALATLAGETTKAATLDLAQLARLLHLSAGVVRTTNGRAAHSSSAPPGPQAAGSRWSCTSSCPTRCTTFRRACTPTGLSSTRSSSSALRRPERRPESSSPGCPGARAGVTANAAIATSSGTRGRCFRSCSRSRPASASPPALHGLPRRRAARPHGRRRDRRVPDRRGDARRRPAGLDQHAPTTGGSVDESPVHFPLVTATHWAGVSSRWGEPWPPGDAVGSGLPPGRRLTM